MRFLMILLSLAGCGGLAWNTTAADHHASRSAMLASVEPGRTTEMRFKTRWGNPTQKIREGAQVSYIYRNMSDPPGYLLPQFGDSTSYVVVVFQYGLAVDAYSSDTEGCRATFAPRPPGAHFPNPTTVQTVGCGSVASADGRAQGRGHRRSDMSGTAPPTRPMVPPDTYTPGPGGK